MEHEFKGEEFFLTVANMKKAGASPLPCLALVFNKEAKEGNRLQFVLNPYHSTNIGMYVRKRPSLHYEAGHSASQPKAAVSVRYLTSATAPLPRHALDRI